MTKKTDARIDLAYCNGFDAGYNAAQEQPEYLEKLLISIEKRRLEALTEIGLVNADKLEVIHD